MNLSFLFMDESYLDVTHIASIVGLLVPVHIYTETRSKFYQIVPRVEKSLPDGRRFIDIRPPELHGCEFLKDFPNVDDDLKFKTFKNVVDLIVTQKIWVYRSGCRIPKDIKKVARKFGVNENFYDLCWARLISMLEMKLVQEMIIPVMDGFQKTTVRSFSQLVKNMDLMRAADMDKIMSIKNTENILGEVFYADSKYGVFTQMVDIVAYLRNVTDCAREGKPLADFKKKLLKISEKLSPVIVQEEICVFGKTNNFTANCERRTTSDEN